MRTLWIAGAALALDQISKWLVMEAVRGRSIPVLGSFFRLTYLENRGAVFGLKLGGPYVHLLFSVVALSLLGVLLWRTPITERLGRTGLALILGGAVGNAVDRVLHGAVIDFLDLGVGSLRWYTFNLADACVTTGAGLLILSCSFLRREGSASDGNGDPAGP